MTTCSSSVTDLIKRLTMMELRALAELHFRPSKTATLRSKQDFRSLAFAAYKAEPLKVATYLHGLHRLPASRRRQLALSFPGTGAHPPAAVCRDSAPCRGHAKAPAVAQRPFQFGLLRTTDIHCSSTTHRVARVIDGPFDPTAFSCRRFYLTDHTIRCLTTSACGRTYLQLRCIDLNTLQLYWPRSMRLRLDGTPLTDCQGAAITSMAKGGRKGDQHFPININKQHCVSGLRSLQIEFDSDTASADEPRDLAMVLIVAEPMDLQPFVRYHTLSGTDTKPLYKAVLGAELDGGDSEESEASDGVDVVATTVSLLDPVFLTRIRRPVRAVGCRHAQCCDLQSMQELASDDGEFKCPVCAVPITMPGGLYEDAFFEQILAAPSTQAAEACTLTLDGERELLFDAIAVQE